MYHTIASNDELQQLISTEDATLIYVSSDECGVCKVLKPKIAELFSEKFPKTTLNYVSTTDIPEIAAQMSIFAIPTVLVFFNGQEFIRESRNIALGILEEKVERPYGMLFEN